MPRVTFVVTREELRQFLRERRTSGRGTYGGDLLFAEDATFPEAYPPLSATVSAVPVPLCARRRGPGGTPRDGGALRMGKCLAVPKSPRASEGWGLPGGIHGQAGSFFGMPCS